MLGGLEPKYRTMHEKTVDAVREHLLYRPMAKGDPDILFSAKAHSSDGTLAMMTYEWEVTHLTCFLGGMFGLGGKIFNRPEDVEIAKKLADGCVWAYDSMPAGVMPEYSRVLPCKKPDDCHFDQAAWYKALDPLSAEQREQRMEEYYTSLAEWKEEVKELEEKEAKRKQAEAEKRQEEARRRAAEEEERRKRPVNSTLPGQEATSAGQQRAASVAEPKHKETVQKRDLGDSNEVPAPAATESNTQKLQDILDLNSNGSHGDDSDQKPMSDIQYPPAPKKPVTHQEYAERRVRDERIPSGFVTLNDKRYILRYVSFPHLPCRPAPSPILILTQPINHKQTRSHRVSLVHVPHHRRRGVAGEGVAHVRGGGAGDADRGGAWGVPRCDARAGGHAERRRRGQHGELLAGRDAQVLLPPVCRARRHLAGRVGAEYGGASV